MIASSASLALRARVFMGIGAGPKDVSRQPAQNPEVPLAVRIRVAISCLPYELPKLAVVAQVSENDFAALLDQRVERMKAIEARGSRRMCRPTN